MRKSTEKEQKFAYFHIVLLYLYAVFVKYS